MTSENPSSAVSQARITGFIAEGYRLVLICSHQLDRSVNPNAEDFSLTRNHSPIAIRTVDLESPLAGFGSWSALMIELEEVVSCDEALQVNYSPKNDGLRSAIDGNSIAPFSVQTAMLLGVASTSLEPSAVHTAEETGAAAVEIVAAESAQVSGKSEPLSAEIVQFDSKAIQLAFADSLDVTVQPRLSDIVVKQDDRRLTVQSAFLSRAQGSCGTALSVELVESLTPGADIRLAYQSTGQSICLSDGTPLTAFQSKVVVVPQIVLESAISNFSGGQEAKASNEAEAVPAEDEETCLLKEPVKLETAPSPEVLQVQAQIPEEPEKATVIAFAKSDSEAAILEVAVEAKEPLPTLSSKVELAPEVNSTEVKAPEAVLVPKAEVNATIEEILSSNISRKPIEESLSELKTEKELQTESVATTQELESSEVEEASVAVAKIEEAVADDDRKMTRRQRRRANLQPVGTPIPVANTSYDRALYQSEVSRSIAKNVVGLASIVIVSVLYLLK